MNDTYLQHHGVQGQRWGVRRYQKEDGKLTRLGKKRFNEVSKNKKESKRVTSDSLKILNKDLKKSQNGIKKIDDKLASSISEMKRNKLMAKRSDLEKISQFTETKISDINSSKIVAGKDFVTTHPLIKIPYVYVTTGPKIGVLEIPKREIIFR